MKRTHTLIVGGGQAGLAMSRCLTDRGIDHVVLERGRVAERWRSERWESLRLLTPNWQTRLPGFRYQGDDPDGFMTVTALVRFLERYASVSRAPVEANTAVLGLDKQGGAFRVRTTRGDWVAENVVVATGHCDVPFVPGIASGLSPDIGQRVPSEYRRPDQLPAGGVLVVGASASGVQLAEELAASGRSVILAVGRHTRLPRRYRGKDILWWMDVMGLLDQGTGEVFDLEVSREQPSLQLVGRPDHRTIDLATLQARGVRLAGRAIRAEGADVWFDDDLVANAVAADAKLVGLLGRIDAFVARAGIAREVGAAEPFAPIWQSLDPAPSRLDLRAEGISTVLWATGFRRRYPWLDVPVLDGRGEIRHTGGITPVPGLYVLGLQFMRRRNSAFIDGVGSDAADLAEDISRRDRRQTAA